MMDNAQLAKASFDDIVFEGRNKNYGAYVLRRLYGRHVMRALIIAVALFALLVGMPLLAKILEKKEEAVVVKTKKTNVIMEPPPLDKSAPPPPPPPPPPPAAVPPPPPPQVATVKFTPPVVKRDEEVRKVEEVPDQKDLKEAAIATKTQEGEKTTANAPLDLGGLEGGTGTSPVEEVVESKVYTYVEQMPQPPGGMEGLMQYLAKNIKYPALALRNQVEGKVFVNFVVGPSGQITDVRVTKGIGAGCDEEAVRVIGKMPAWSPGKQNGRAVSVSYTVPVTFTIK